MAIKIIIIIIMILIIIKIIINKYRLVLDQIMTTKVYICYIFILYLSTCIIIILLYYYIIYLILALKCIYFLCMNNIQIIHQIDTDQMTQIILNVIEIAEIEDIMMTHKILKTCHQIFVHEII